MRLEDFLRQLESDDLAERGEAISAVLLPAVRQMAVDQLAPLLVVGARVGRDGAVDGVQVVPLGSVGMERSIALLQLIGATALAGGATDGLSIDLRSARERVRKREEGGPSGQPDAFDRAWDRMADAGHVDSRGGAQYNRLRAGWEKCKRPVGCLGWIGQAVDLEEAGWRIVGDAEVTMQADHDQGDGQPGVPLP